MCTFQTAFTYILLYSLQQQDEIFFSTILKMWQLGMNKLFKVHILVTVTLAFE